MTDSEQKYQSAIDLYRNTDLTITEISRRCGVSRSGLASHIQRHYRALMYDRHGIDSAPDTTAKLQTPTGQRERTRQKYSPAIDACASPDYIEMNVSQIARIFGLDATSLGNQLKIHYPHVLEWRLKERAARGYADNIRRGVRPSTVRAYARAVEMLRTSDVTVEAAAEATAVSVAGLHQHILMYHKDLVADRSERRVHGKNCPVEGTLSGNGTIRRPFPHNTAKYAEAVELYRTTPLKIREICRRTGVNPIGFRNHLRMWHRPLMEARQEAAAHEAASTASAHRRPALPAAHASRMPRSYSKYAEALEVFRTTPEPLKSIARRFNIHYNSIGGFVRRNMPELIAEHNSLLKH